jgi:hypothetical protein
VARPADDPLRKLLVERYAFGDRKGWKEAMLDVVSLDFDHDVMETLFAFHDRLAPSFRAHMTHASIYHVAIMDDDDD